MEMNTSSEYIPNPYTSPSQNDSVNWAKVIFSVLICVFGIIGNGISIFIVVVLKEYKKSVLHMYVLQLAIADMVFLLTLPFKVQEDLHNQWVAPEWVCTAKETMLFLNYNASVLFLIVMSIDRYISVCHPFSVGLKRFREPEISMLVVSLVWVVALLSCLPVLSNTRKSGRKPNCRCQFRFPVVEEQTVEERCNATTAIDTKMCIEMILKVEREEKLCLDPEEFVIPGFGSENWTEEDIAASFNLGDLDVMIFDDNATDYFQQMNNNQPSSFNGQSSLPSAAMHTESYSYECNYWENPREWKKFLYINFIVLYILPLMAMSLAYGLIIRRVKETKMPSANSSNSKKMDAFRRMESQNNDIGNNYGGGGGQQKKKPPKKTPNIRQKVNVMCASLVLTFAICWLPFHAVHLAKIRGIPLKESQGYICTGLSSFGTLLGYFNSVLNPLFYSFFGTDFAKRWTNARSTIKKNISPAVGSLATSKRKTTKAESCHCTKASVLSKTNTRKPLLTTKLPVQRSLVNI